MASRTKLAPQERALARLLLAGVNERDAALALGLSLRSIRNHLQTLFSHFNTGSREELIAALAAADGLGRIGETQDYHD